MPGRSRSARKSADAGISILFDEYQVLSQSGLFDAGYYLGTNPDVAAGNLDPLLHYLERGAREGRNPSPAFDTGYYLAQCRALGDIPENPLFHFVTSGSQRGLTAHPQSKSSAGVAPRATPHSMLCVDIPRIVGGAADAPVRGGLSIVGWAMAPGFDVRVDVALDGTRVTGARHGLRRPDVAAAHPFMEGAISSGYTAHIPPKALAVGNHQVAVELNIDGGVVARVEFRIAVEEIPDDRGPWALRRKLRRAEVELQLALLARQRWKPRFRVVVAVKSDRPSLTRVLQTIRSVVRQEYAHWELQLLPADAGLTAGPLRKNFLQTLAREFSGALHRITLRDAKPAPGSARRTRISTRFVLLLRPGDELGCDALLEFAVAGASEPGADFIFGDERCAAAADGRVEAYFKPAWSPDLLLSCNYIGRAWCAQQRLADRAGLGMVDLAALGDYDAVLRLTEAARHILHVPRVLQQRAGGGDSALQERRALTSALRRRGVDAKVLAGRVTGHHRVKRALTGGRVSIIIPTCAANGLIETCIDTLRALTAYADYEIICIENIPAAESRWKRWLPLHADVVIEAREDFNWSRYNNIAAARAAGRYLLFLNDDVEIIEPEWLGALLEQAQRPEVGVVGPQLLYPDRSVQHAGVMLDSVGRGRHAFRHLSENDPGYFGLALTVRNVIAVTGACLLTSARTFQALSGFDEAHSVINNDLDFCLRAWHSGLLNVYTPYARLIHHEMASRGPLREDYDVDKFQRQWAGSIASGDPYFNTHLSRDAEQFTIEREPLETVHAGHPVFARDAVQNILVVKLDHIGDCLTALPALRRIKRLFPAAHISVLAGRSTRSIWSREKIVDDVIEFNFFNARSGLGKHDVTPQELAALGDVLCARHFDLAIDLRKQPDSRFILPLCGAQTLVGFDSQGRFPWLDVALEWDEDVPLRAKHGHVGDDLLALVEAVAVHSDPHRAALMSAPSATLSLPKAERRSLFARPLVCIHAAAGSPMRQWPLASFAQLIDLLLQQGGLNVALIGGHDERAIAADVLARVADPRKIFDLIGKFSLDELPTFLSECSLFVGNNSGPQHMAAALGIPTVGIHSGVVDANEWGPLGPRAVALRRQMSCSPCYIELVKDCPRGLECLKKLSAADVYRTCKRLLLTAGIAAHPG